MSSGSNNTGARFPIAPDSAESYLAAVVLVALASLLRWGLGFFGPLLLPFTTYYPVILFSTYLGGPRVGSFAALLGGLIGWWAFLPPQFAFFPASIESGVELLIYAVAAALIIWGADSYRRLADRLRAEEKLRELAVNELAHRLKNKIASIQSILAYQLRDQPQLRDDIIARLIALSATDDLIMAAQGRGAHIRRILSTELAPYGLSRLSMGGPDILLAPTLALTMALLIHELATNAAKHGALSSPSGSLAISWSLLNGVLSLDWRESGGPPVTAPAHRGFGLQLLSRALEQFNGAAETLFEPSGLSCRLKATLPDSPPRTVAGEEPSSAAA